MVFNKNLSVSLLNSHFKIRGTKGFNNTQGSDSLLMWSTAQSKSFMSLSTSPNIGDMKENDTVDGG